MEKIENITGKRVLIADGAMGTLLVDMGYDDMSPEEVLLKDYRIIRDIHRDYTEAGADIVITDTFGASRIKLSEFSLQDRQEKIIHLAVKAAREGSKGKAYVAGSIGPAGSFLLPFGELKEKDAYQAFRKQAELLVREEVDLIIIETMTDMKELKLALRAVKKVSRKIPVIIQMSFDSDLRTVTGTPVKTFIDTFSSFNVLALGANCGRGLKEMKEVSDEFKEHSALPFSVQPNAGIPRVIRGKVEYPSSPGEMADYAEKFYYQGASIIGSCCGSTPSHTREIAARVKGRKIKKNTLEEKRTVITSRTESVYIGSGMDFVMVGERINPTGKSVMTRDLKRGVLSSVKKEARNQVEAGAHILDVNISVGAPDRESSMMKKAVRALENTVNVPLLIDSPFIRVIESGLKVCSARSFINSITGEEDKMVKLLELAEEYGAGFIALLIDEQGVPDDYRTRIKILEKILEKSEEMGFDSKDMLIDPGVTTVATSSVAIKDILKTIEIVKNKYNLSTIIGLSNISHGLPRRKLINRAFLSMAVSAGLDSAILDPLDSDLREELRADELLAGRDRKGSRYIEKFRSFREREETHEMKESHSLYDMIIKGEKEGLKEETEKLMNEMKYMEIINDVLVKAIREVGEKYNNGEYFLPQVMSSAHVVENAFELIKKRFKDNSGGKGDIVLATVKGDVHDIGKNIVKTIFTSHGYSIIDLGKDVPVEIIFESVKKNRPIFVGLSALLTPSLVAVRDTVEYIRSRMETPPFIMVGGAVVDEEFASEIDVYYAEDALSGVSLIEEVLSSS